MPRECFHESGKWAEDSGSFGRGNDHRVGFLHFTGSPENLLQARVVQTPDAPMQRAFEIQIHCLTTVFHDCRGFDELAPAAWVDYLARQQGKATRGGLDD